MPGGKEKMKVGFQVDMQLYTAYKLALAYRDDLPNKPAQDLTEHMRRVVDETEIVVSGTKVGTEGEGE